MRSRIAFLGLTFIASPALADHVGPSGVGGGSVNVLSPETLDEGHVGLGLRATYTDPEARSDAELAALAGEHIHAHNTDYTLNGSLGAAYGLTHRFTLSFELPYLRRDHLREGTHGHIGGQSVNGVETLGSVSGIGDASLLGRYRLVEGPATALSLIGGIKLPTGSTHRRSNDGERLETEHQPGTGSWDPVVGAAFGTVLGLVRLSASALYQFSGSGAQRTRLGDRAQAGFALSHRLGPPEHHHAEGEDHGAEEHAPPGHHGHSSWDLFVEMSAEWEGRQRLAGAVESASGGKALWLTPGARFNAAGGLSVTFALGVPAWQHIRASHPANRSRLTVSIGRAF